MKITINKKHKSIPSDIVFDLPKFTVITGKNGSGKSHLLEAIANNQISTIYDNGQQLSKIQLIGFGGLNPQIEETCDPQQIVQRTKNIWNQIEGRQLAFKQEKDNNHTFDDPIITFLPRWGKDEVNNTIENIYKKSSIKFEDLTEDDIYYNLDVSNSNQNSIFASQLALVFKSYHSRYTKNQFKQFLIEKNKQT